MAQIETADLFFRDIVSSYVDAPRFLRRDWLAAELQERLDAPGRRFALLTAEPGAGKSAFMAQLAADHPDWLRFFIRRDQRTSMGEGSARSLLLRIGFQLAALHPELFDMEQIRIDVEQVIGVADGELVGAAIDRIRASPFHQTIVHITQEVRHASGSVAGLRVGEWIADPRLIELEDLQHMALYGPASTLLRTAPDARIVILIDALDELRFGEDEGNLLQWLAVCPPLPANVRIVLTSRPSREQLAAFVERRGDVLALLPLESGDRRMQDDIRAYAATLVEPAAVGAALQESGRRKDAFVNELVARADGNIGYASAVGRAFDRALAGPEHRELLARLLALERLPDDVRQLFAFFLRLIQSGPGAKDVKVTDPTSGRAAVVEAWPELYQPILALLAVAVQPLTIDQAHVLSGTLAARAQVAHALGWLDQFLDRLGDRYRLYHATFASFLTAPETRANEQTTDLWVDPVKAHRRLAAVLEDGGLDAIWEDSLDTGEQGRRDYTRLHYIAHLYLGGNWERLAAAVESGEYGRGKLRFDRSAWLYSQDVDLAIRAEAREGRDEKDRLGALPRLWSFRLLRATLSSYASRLPAYAFSALAIVGRDREASDLAELIADTRRQSLALIRIARVLAGRPEDAGRAAELVRRAGEIAVTVEDPAGRDALSDEIVDLADGIDPASDAAAAALEAAVALARSFPDAADRAETLANAALALHAAGRGDEAIALRSEIEALLEGLDDVAAQAVRYSWAMLSVELGDADAALAAVEKLPDPAARLSVLVHLAGRHEAGGEGAAAARAAIEAIRSRAAPYPARIHATVALAEADLDAGDAARASSLLAEALDELQAGGGGQPDLYAALAVARGLHRADDPGRLDAAAGIVQAAAVVDLDEPGDAPRQGFTFSLRAAEGARGLAGLDRTTQALEIVRRLNVYERGGLLRAIVDGHVRREEFDEAIAIVDEMQQNFRDSPMRISAGGADPYMDDAAALMAISGALASRAEWQRALDVAARVPDAEARVDAFSRVAILMSEAGMKEAAELVEQIMRGVRLGNTGDGRDEALRQVCELFGRAKQWPKAREVAQTIESPWVRADAQASIQKSLVEAGEFDAAQQMLPEIESPSARAESLLALLRAVHDAGGTPTRPVDGQTTVRMLGVARGYAQQDEDKMRAAAALRAIAKAFGDLHTGDVDGAFAALRASVDTMNAVPRFPFVPTPWCDTAVAFAGLGHWDLALKLANWQVETNPLDGCCSLRDLAAFAGKSGDADRAKALFAQARDSVQRVTIPPQRSDVLVSIAKEYARLGMLDEARDTARASGSQDEADAQIAVGLIQSERVADGTAALDALAGRIPERMVFPVITALLDAGEIDRARTMAATIPNPVERAGRLVQVARRQIAAGKPDDARATIGRALALSRALGDPRSWPARGVLESLPAAFAELEDFISVRQFVEDCWLSAASRADLLSLIALAGPLVPRVPDLPERIHASFGWVEQTLLAV